MLAWTPPAHSPPAAQQPGSKSTTYYEQELDRLKSWHPQQSRFRKECERRSSSSGGGAAAASAPPHSFLHPRDASPEQH